MDFESLLRGERKKPSSNHNRAGAGADDVVREQHDDRLSLPAQQQDDVQDDQETHNDDDGGDGDDDDDDNNNKGFLKPSSLPTLPSSQQQQQQPPKKAQPCISLEQRCRLFIVAHLDQYVPESFGCLPEDDWESIVELRHLKTQPTFSKNKGLDGKGRLTSAIRADIMKKIETANPHLAESSKTDRWVWKDCVNQKFKLGGFTRPLALNYPWPLLVSKIQTSGQHLLDYLSSQSSQQEQDNGEQEEELPNPQQQLKQHNRSSKKKKSWNLETEIDFLAHVPMNVSLLQATSIGKTVRQFIKQCKKLSKNHAVYNIVHDDHRIVPPTKSGGGGEPSPKLQQSPVSQLEELLQSWKNLAKASGVQVTSSNNKNNQNIHEQQQQQQQQQQYQKDLELCEQCKSWRDLYQTLQNREVTVRANQGARMREIRQNLNKGRPKIVKVRPTSSKHLRILEHKQHQQQAAAFARNAPPNPAARKMNQLRQETASLSALRHNTNATSKASRKRPAVPSFDTRTTTTTAIASSGSNSGFGAAVQFASGPTKLRTAASTMKKMRTMNVTRLSGNKQMKLPAHKTAPRNALLANRTTSPHNSTKKNRKPHNTHSRNTQQQGGHPRRR